MSSLRQTDCPVTNPTTTPDPDRLATDPRTLRRQLRAARRALPPRVQHRHAESLARVLGRFLGHRRTRRLGAYWPADGEADPAPLLARPGARRWQPCLPVLGPLPNRRRLWFVQQAPGSALEPNRFGIPEPRRGRRVPVWALDLILVPLVGFDADCHRLGMGGGYYDRTLAFLKHRRHWRRPVLIGLAHECQHCATLAPRPWDVPLDAVATERRVYRRRPRT